jgi:arylsulfatase A-like enzyme
VSSLPDVLLVGWDDVALADATADVCPTLAAFRAGALDLPLGFANPVCSQSRAVLLFGAHGRTLGILRAMDAGDHEGPIPPASWPTIASVLAAAGYRTALVGKWHLGRAPLGGDVGLAPLQRGYEFWRAGTLANIGGAQAPGRNFSNWDRLDSDAVLGVLRSVSTRYATLAQVEEAEAWWAANAEAPRFLHVALNDPHGPYTPAPPPELLAGWPSPPPGASTRTRFLAKLRAADTALARLLALPGATDALVVLYADNGTAGNAAPPEADPERAKTTTFERGIRVPLVARFPGVAAGTHDELVHLVDVPTAVLERLGLPVPEEWDGRTNPRNYVIAEAELADGTLEQAVRTRTHKLRATRPPGGARAEELYDLAADPGELAPMDLGAPENQQLLLLLRIALYGPGG